MRKYVIYNQESKLSVESAQKCIEVAKNIGKIEKKEDLFDRNHKFEVIKVDASFPRYIYKNKEKFKDFIYSD